MKYSEELIKKAKACKSAEELQKVVKENGVVLSDEEAAREFAYLNKSGELSDNELNNIAGGGCIGESGEDPKFSVNQNVVLLYSSDGNGNKCKGVITEVCGKKPTGEFYYKVRYNCVIGETESYILESRLELA